MNIKIKYLLMRKLDRRVVWSLGTAYIERRQRLFDTFRLKNEGKISYEEYYGIKSAIEEANATVVAVLLNIYKFNNTEEIEKFIKYMSKKECRGY